MSTLVSAVGTILMSTFITDLLSGYDANAQLNSIEDLIYQQAPLSVVLRLICLASITQGGIKQKILDNLKREVLQVRTPHYAFG